MLMPTLDLRGRLPNRADLIATLPRAELDVDAAMADVAPIIADVRSRGTAAIAEYTQRFDGVLPASLRVPTDALHTALADLDPAVRAGLEVAIQRTRQVHEDQVPTPIVTDVAPGAQVRQRWLPVERVGLYVPGGLAVYPSSVVMNVVPAQAAGVRSLAVASPPQASGLPHPTVLAACALLRVDEVYAVGGAQAIAMFAYGARNDSGSYECEPVSVITGPGNVYVAAAKRAVRGVVGIDAEAGPTEIAILADETAHPTHVATDLISQAEHDPLAASVLVTDSTELAEAVLREVSTRARATKHAERVTTALSGAQSAIVLVDDLEAGIEVVNAYAAEHLEIHTRDAAAIAERITAAGAIFVGTYSPVPLGDYLAGSNHVLPTGGASHYASGLGVHSFLRAVQVIEYDEAALAQVGHHIVALANDEDLPAHGEAIEARFESADG